MARIFLSHSSRDNQAAAEIKNWLDELQFTCTFLDFDKHSGIEPGADWEKTLYTELERAQAILILQTSNWVESKWCFAEFTQARALGKKIFPMILEPRGETTIGSDLQRIDLTRDRDAGLASLKDALLDLGQTGPAGFTLERNTSPFPGLAAFDTDQAAVFFGRDDEIRDGLDRLRAVVAHGDPRFLVVLGASGSGKSSLLRAGLIPRLKRDRLNWIVLDPIRPGTHPAWTLTERLILATGADHAAQHDGWRAALAGVDAGAALAGITRALRQRHASALDATILLPVDQLEQAFTLPDTAEKARFFRLLTALLTQDLPVAVIATMRVDHLEALVTASERLAAAALLHLPPMPVARIEDLIRGPAHIAGLTVEDSLVSTLQYDARTVNALPLVAFALNRLYESKARTSGRLTLTDYEALGPRTDEVPPLVSAIQTHGEMIITTPALSSDEEEALREAFISCLARVSFDSKGDKVKILCQPTSRSALPEMALPLVDRLVEARLLTSASDDSKGTVIEVSHEALLTAWPRIAHWLRTEHEYLLGRERLRQAFRHWKTLEADQKPRALLTGLLLDQAKLWLENHSMSFIDQEEIVFINNSTIHRENENKKKIREKSLFIRVLASSVVLLIIAISGTTYFYAKTLGEANQKEKALSLAEDRHTIASTLIDDALKIMSGAERDTVWGFEQIEAPLLQKLTEAQNRLTDQETPSIDHVRRISNANILLSQVNNANISEKEKLDIIISTYSNAKFLVSQPRPSKDDFIIFCKIFSIYMSALAEVKNDKEIESIIKFSDIVFSKITSIYGYEIVNSPTHAWIAWAYFAIADYLYQNKKYEESVQRYHVAISWIDKALNYFPNSLEILADKSIMLSTAQNALRAIRQINTADLHHQKSCQIAQEILSLSPNHRHAISADISCLFNWYYIYISSHDKHLALKMLDKIEEHLLKVKRFGDYFNYTIAYIYYLRANALRLEGSDLNNSRSYYNKSLETYISALEDGSPAIGGRFKYLPEVIWGLSKILDQESSNIYPFRNGAEVASFYKIFQNLKKCAADLGGGASCTSAAIQSGLWLGPTLSKQASPLAVDVLSQTRTLALSQSRHPAYINLSTPLFRVCSITNDLGDALRKAGRSGEATKILQENAENCGAEYQDRFLYDIYLHDAWTFSLKLLAELIAERGDEIATRAAYAACAKAGRPSCYEPYALMLEQGRGGSVDSREAKRMRAMTAFTGVRTFDLRLTDEITGADYKTSVHVFSRPDDWPYRGIDDQAIWLEREHGVVIPQNIRDDFIRMEDNAKQNGVPFVEWLSNNYH